MKKFFLVFLSFLAVTLIFYWGLWSTYFQQDEWFLFGRAIYESQHLPWSLFNFASMHFWPLGNLLWLIFYKLFGLHSAPYAIFAISIHALAGTTLFFFFEKITKNVRVSFLLGLLFVCSFPAMQPVAWLVIPPLLITCTIFILAFIIYLANCKDKKQISKRDVTALSLLFTAAYFFREEAVILLPMLPAYIYLFWGKNKKRTLKPVVFLLFIMGVLLILRFVLEHFLGDNVVFTHEGRRITTLYNILTIPPKMIVQNMFDLTHLWDFSRQYTFFAFPRLLPDGIAIEQTIFEHIVLIILIPISFITGFAFSIMDGREKRIFLFSILWISMCSVVISPQTRRLIFLESRYLYLANVGVLLFFYAIVSAVSRKINKKTIYILVSIFLGVFLIDSYVNIQTYINNIYRPRSEMRTSILAQIQKSHPSIPDNTVIFIECKGVCVPTLVVPFQSGFGQMLMVIYAKDHEKAYAPFFKQFYLWDWEAQGYKKNDKVSFGYFRDYKTLLHNVRQHTFPISYVIAYQYDYSRNIMKEVTMSVRKKLNDDVQLGSKKNGSQK